MGVHVRGNLRARTRRNGVSPRFARGIRVAVAIEAFIWGGTQITWLRVAIAALAELLLIAYVVWAARFLGR
jgi:hypothetical protein